MAANQQEHHRHTEIQTCFLLRVSPHYCWQGTGKSLGISSHRDQYKSELLPTGLLPPQPTDLPWSQRNSTRWCSQRNTGPAAQFLKVKFSVLANIIICTVCKLLWNAAGKVTYYKQSDSTTIRFLQHTITKALTVFLWSMSLDHYSQAVVENPILFRIRFHIAEHSNYKVPSKGAPFLAVEFHPVLSDRFVICLSPQSSEQTSLKTWPFI